MKPIENFLLLFSSIVIEFLVVSSETEIIFQLSFNCPFLLLASLVKILEILEVISFTRENFPADPSAMFRQLSFHPGMLRLEATRPNGLVEFHI